MTLPQKILKRKQSQNYPVLNPELFMHVYYIANYKIIQNTFYFVHALLCF